MYSDLTFWNLRGFCPRGFFGTKGVPYGIKQGQISREPEILNDRIDREDTMRDKRVGSYVGRRCLQSSRPYIYRRQCGNHSSHCWRSYSVLYSHVRRTLPHTLQTPAAQHSAKLKFTSKNISV